MRYVGDTFVQEYFNMSKAHHQHLERKWFLNTKI